MDAILYDEMTTQVGDKADAADPVGSAHAKLKQIINDVQNAAKLYKAVSSDTLQASADTAIYTDSTTYIIGKEIVTGYTGKHRISFDILPSSTNTVYGQITKNGVAYGIERGHSGEDTWITYTEDLTFSAGDVIGVQYKSSSSAWANVRNFRVYYTVNEISNPTYVVKDS